MQNCKIIILAAIIPFIAVSCSNNNKLKIYEFVTEKELVFPLDNQKSGKPTFWDIFFDYTIIDGKESLIIPINHSRLAFYDISTQKEYHSIPLNPNATIKTFKFVNKDSIFVYYRQEFEDFINNKFIDDTISLQMIDYYGNVKDCLYDLNYSFLENKTINYNDIIPFYYPLDELCINNGKLFIATSTHNREVIGSKKFYEKNYPLFVFYDTKTEEVKISKNIKYPYIKENIFYPYRGSQYINYCISENKLPVLRFFYSSDVFEWDYINDKLTKHSLKSRILDTIYPLKNENSTPEENTAWYSNITYNPFCKMYYSYLFIKEDNNNFLTLILILADEKFNYLGEVVNPNIGGMLKFTKEHIISYGYYNDSIHISYKKIVKTNRLLQPYLDSVRNVLEIKRQAKEIIYKQYEKAKNPLLSFFHSKFKETEKDYTLLTFYEGGGCESCENELKRFISQNNRIFDTLPFYMIITGNKQSVIDGTYETFTNLNLIQDTFGIAQHFAYEENKYTMLNPRLTIVRNDVVVLDTIYDSFHIESDLIPTMLESLGLKQ